MNWTTLLFALHFAGFHPQHQPNSQARPQIPTTLVGLGGNMTLPGLKGLGDFEEGYEMGEVLAQIPSPIKGIATVRVGVTTDQAIAIELVDASKSVANVWRLDIGEFNANNLSVKLAWTDANYDTAADELVIWWSTQDGTNGMLEGYEMEREGVLILNVNDGKDIVNFTYHDRYASYVAGKGVNTESEDFHAKMDDNSVWNICDYSYDVALKDGDLLVSGALTQVENMKDCHPAKYKEGKYEYNYENGLFETEGND